MVYTAIRAVLEILIQLLYFFLIGRIILTFLRSMSQTRYPPLVEQIYRVLFLATEPFLRPLRNLVPNVSMGMGYLDLSPLLLLLILSVIRQIVFLYL